MGDQVQSTEELVDEGWWSREEPWAITIRFKMNKADRFGGKPIYLSVGKIKKDAKWLSKRINLCVKPEN